MAIEADVGDLNQRLDRAAKVIDESAKLIRDIGFNPEQNMRRLAHALTDIFEVQHEIYDRYPDLEPDFLKSRREQREGGSDAT